MNNQDYYNIEAIKDAIDLTKHYPLEVCLTQCQALCDSLDDDEQFSQLMGNRRSNECLKEIIRLSAAKYGARNLLSALLYLEGDTDGHQLQLAAHKIEAEKALKELNQLMQGYKPFD